MSLSTFDLTVNGLTSFASRAVRPEISSALQDATGRVRVILVELHARLDAINSSRMFSPEGKQEQRTAALIDASDRIGNLANAGADWSTNRAALAKQLEPRPPVGDPTVRALEAAEIRAVLLAEPDDLKRELLFREALESSDIATILAVLGASKLLQRRLVVNQDLLDEARASLGKAQSPEIWKEFQMVDKAFQTYQDVLRAARGELQTLGLAGADPLAAIAAG